ncbi:hypothetical protein DFH08DRAFT_822950 [Mycena albidolilacea]|uniref:Uncharacterized protein n=1 Tax=Mycena albidolilacea TaxID=1033008 RepID=A0AAD7ECP7_9AGAR|nr:hypothetical protein DFH08DRAFT_822950 [Mycena albidolilacea]
MNIPLRFQAAGGNRGVFGFKSESKRDQALRFKYRMFRVKENAFPGHHSVDTVAIGTYFSLAPIFQNLVEPMNSIVPHLGRRRSAQPSISISNGWVLNPTCGGSSSLLDTLHVILLGIFYYRYTVTNFGDYAPLQAISTWSLLGKAQVVVEDIIALMVQLFAISLFHVSERTNTRDGTYYNNGNEEVPRDWCSDSIGEEAVGRWKSGIAKWELCPYVLIVHSKHWTVWLWNWFYSRRVSFTPGVICSKKKRSLISFIKVNVKIKESGRTKCRMRPVDHYCHDILSVVAEATRQAFQGYEPDYQQFDALETSWDALQNTVRSYGFKWLAAHSTNTTSNYGVAVVDSGQKLIGSESSQRDWKYHIPDTVTTSGRRGVARGWQGVGWWWFETKEVESRRHSLSADIVGDITRSTSLTRCCRTLPPRAPIQCLFLVVRTRTRHMSPTRSLSEKPTDKSCSCTSCTALITSRVELIAPTVANGVIAWSIAGLCYMYNVNIFFAVERTMFEGGIHACSSSRVGYIAKWRNPGLITEHSRNAPRFDCIIYETDDDPIAMGELCFVFRCHLPGNAAIDLAMVRPFRKTTWQPNTRTDCPIREKMPATTASFITLEHIVRSTLLCPIFGGKAGMHYIIDCVDEDIPSRLVLRSLKVVGTRMHLGTVWDVLFSDDVRTTQWPEVIIHVFAIATAIAANTRQHLREKMNGDVQLYSSGQLSGHPSAIAFASGGTQTIGSAVDMEGSQDNFKAPGAF